MSLFAETLNYKFNNPHLLERALTHKSYSHELKDKVEHNEKLEFLGDAVLDLVVGEYLYEAFPEDTEGGLSKKRASIVNEEILSEIAINRQLNSLLRLGKGETLSGGAAKPRLAASCLEAILGAIYLDGGFAIVKEVIRREFTETFKQVCEQEDFEKDYKTRLQELVQKTLKEAPRYEVLSEEGPSHDRVFLVCVRVNQEVWGQGQGRSKKVAEQAAAKKALEERFKEAVNVGI